MDTVKSDDMTEYKDIKEEVKENTPKMAGITGPTVGVLILIVQELREMNEHLKKIADKHIDSGVI